VEREPTRPPTVPQKASRAKISPWHSTSGPLTAFSASRISATNAPRAGSGAGSRSLRAGNDQRRLRTPGIARHRTDVVVDGMVGFPLRGRIRCHEMPRAKQKDPVEAHEADVVVPARANGATRNVERARDRGQGPGEGRKQARDQVLRQGCPSCQARCTQEAEVAPAVAPKAAVNPKTREHEHKSRKGPRQSRPCATRRLRAPPATRWPQDTAGDDDEPRTCSLAPARPVDGRAQQLHAPS